MIRDYNLHPLLLVQNGSVRYREKPFKEDVIELYIEQNKSVKECSKYFGLNLRMFQTILKEFGIKKDRKQVYKLQKKTLLETKGVENVFQLDDVKEKIRQTNLEKYGKETYTQTNEYKIKNIETRRSRYGDDPYCREKYRNTCKNKWGVDNSSQSHFTDVQKDLLNRKELCEKFIKDNNILTATDFSIKSGIKFYATLTLLHKFDLMKMFDYKTSSQERFIQDYLTKNNIKYIPHYKIGRKEIDVYVPELKLGIEFNGNYYHCEGVRPNDYHYQKSKLAEENGIFIYHIFEYEWDSIKEKILNQLNNLLNINKTKIYARKCLIKEVSKKDKKSFLDKNHIQGNDHSKIYLGLYYNDELVSLMTFSKPHNTNKIQYELSRFCSKAGCNVLGGASKLFKFFVNTYNPKTIISYSNIAHTRGNLYETLGFIFSHTSKPSYVWNKNRKILSRYQTRIKELKQKGFYGENEIEIMHNLGYVRIFDCGNKVWIWHNNKNIFVNDK